MKLLVLGIFLFSVFLSAEEIKFPKQKIKVGKVEMTVEVAKTSKHRSRGLMFRTSLEEGTGMLFEFRGERRRSFWMKNTFLPLSIAFFNKKKEIVDIQHMNATKSMMQQNFDQILSAKPATYALEVPRGWFSKVGIKLGDRLVFLNQPRP